MIKCEACVSNYNSIKDNCSIGIVLLYLFNSIILKRRSFDNQNTGERQQLFRKKNPRVSGSSVLVWLTIIIKEYFTTYLNYTILLLENLILFQLTQVKLYNILSNQCLESDSCQLNSTSDIYHCDETYCIPKSFVCNGIPDCFRGQDEAVSECGICIIYFKLVTIRLFVRLILQLLFNSSKANNLKGY
ncbi:G-protein coupled receptor GRL101-like [Aphis craccivora]|uniref:G-protein coupled receptor GRL101-like n=1 Tax=Aphis craccivora TaxID=307492 RepID=A0A6G0W2R5_APHCR|nr:G-protein coupled receptor GRL101-like [Aphis craccivora]